MELDSEDDSDDDLREVEDELLITDPETSTSRHLISPPSSKVYLQPTKPPEPTPVAVAGECPLCTRPFSDNDELNAHVDWCLSREAIRSAQAEGDKTERKKPESRSEDIHEWWKAPSLEGNVQNQRKKRRKLEGL